MAKCQREGGQYHQLDAAAVGPRESRLKLAATKAVAATHLAGAMSAPAQHVVEDAASDRDGCDIRTPPMCR